MNLQITINTGTPIIGEGANQLIDSIYSDGNIQKYLYYMIKPPKFNTLTNERLKLRNEPQNKIDQFVQEVVDAALTQPYYQEGKIYNGIPIFSKLQKYMVMVYGNAFFQEQKINKAMQLIMKGIKLQVFIKNTNLTNNLNGWFKGVNLQEFVTRNNSPEFKNYIQFFTRKFKNMKQSRPIIKPNPLDSQFVINPCQATCVNGTFQQGNVANKALIFNQGSKYSLKDMLKLQENDPLLSYYHDGYVYQANLNAKSYQGWCSPISGKISRILDIPGLIFGREHSKLSKSNDDRNHFFTVTAPRKIIQIKGNNFSLLLILIGTGPVDSLISKVQTNDQVQQGDQIGYFELPGFSVCMVFKKGIIQSVNQKLKNQNHSGRVNDWIAKVTTQAPQLQSTVRIQNPEESRYRSSKKNLHYNYF